MDSIRAIKIRFTAIISGISLLFIFNLLYLNGLYSSISEETAGIITLCIEEADGEELQKRLPLIASLTDERHETIYISKSIAKEDNGMEDEKGMDTMSGIPVFSELVKEVRLKVHQSIDSIIPPDLTLLDSLIVAGFRNKGISTGLYYTETIDLKDGRVISSSRKTKTAEASRYYVYEYDRENRYAYRVYTASTTKAVLGRMSGILTTTLLIVLLLGYAFRFFIKTVVRQKTLEEMKQDFTNNMTHELKTPISVAYSAVDTLLNFRQGENSEKRRQYLNICMEQLSNLRDLVEQILSISMERSREIPLEKENVVLKPLLENIAEQQRLNTKKCIDMDISVQPEGLTVYADIKHLSSIIGNLVDNAVKYSSDSVAVHITAYRDETCCIISVKDNGMGIDAENRKHIFDRFYRVPQGNLHNVKGYGLGLFYVKTMIERHKGSISVKSETGKGSEFLIKIPAK